VILLTGGTGFIGRRLLARLLERGERVRVLVRPQSLGRVPASPVVEAAPGDLVDASSIDRAVDGCETVLHLVALRAHCRARPSMFERVNVDGTRALLQAAFAHHVRRVVHVSTSIVFGPSHGTPKDESDWQPPFRFYNEYQRTKFLADEEVQRFVAEGLPVVSVFPSVVYGPVERRGENPVTDTALTFASGRFVPIVGRGDRLRNLVYVEDVVEGILLALGSGRPGQGYILGGEDASPRMFLSLLSDLTGRPMPRWSVPMGLARALAWLIEPTARVGGAWPPLTLSSVAILEQEWTVSSRKAEAELGYCRRPLKDGLRETLTASLARSLA
jgi:nucleoside-diphosphate-sugar epimerase